MVPVTLLNSAASSLEEVVIFGEWLFAIFVGWLMKFQNLGRTTAGLRPSHWFPCYKVSLLSSARSIQRSLLIQTGRFWTEYSRLYVYSTILFSLRVAKDQGGICQGSGCCCCWVIGGLAAGFFRTASRSCKEDIHQKSMTDSARSLSSTISSIQEASN